MCNEDTPGGPTCATGPSRAGRSGQIHEDAAADCWPDRPGDRRHDGGPRPAQVQA
ncbi:hypothetical protein Ae168Ps1_2999 [Pseudonocardia sp. Ae168_Ps1]|nr:hypothetical protein Ae150APs1_2992 [Pseudonocardia sp. Ae150A_Ps1]OLL80593.1 hypothetical protein Ae168Ps1_2999 [Pseudonocardia sp. Ae168_Ps1]OLL94696.1 hypothetical protein Ae356Ps1_4593 [Pseudonocardia sp. Ae356_Ps1]